MFGLNNENARIKELQREVAESKNRAEWLKSERDELQEQIDRFERTQQVYEREAQDQVEDVRRDARLERQGLEEQIKTLKKEIENRDSELDHLRALKTSEAEMLKQEIELEAKVAMLDAAEADMHNIKQTLANERNHAKQLAATSFEQGKTVGEAEGYVEGFKEGAKTVNSLTTTDRQLAFVTAQKAAANVTSASGNDVAPQVTVNNSNRE